MIRLLNLTLQRGPQRLLEAAELTLHAGQKAGLIGANGAGKSSLFALLRGQLGQDAGDCLLPADWRIAHMRQEVDTLDRLAVDYVLDGDSRLREIQAALAVAEAARRFCPGAPAYRAGQRRRLYRRCTGAQAAGRARLQQRADGAPGR